MARTPLMRTLLRWITNAEIARKNGKTTEQLEDERRKHRLSRRSILVAGAGAAALAACGGTDGASDSAVAAQGDTQSSLRTSKKIAIVGGGISGLTCALHLRDNGVRATIYEASGRTGGRMFSKTSGWDDDQVSEWCGELIDSGHETIRSLARRFNLTLENVVRAEPNNSEDTLYFGGTYYKKADLERDWAAVSAVVQADTDAAGYPTSFDTSTPEGQALDNMSVYDWIESRIPGGHRSKFGQLLDVAYAIEYGADTTDQSALNLLYLLGFQPEEGDWALFGVSDEVSHIRGGNQKLPTRIADHLGDRAIDNGMRLESIRQRADGSLALSFRTHGRSVTVNADIVILALPFAVLRNIDIAEAGFDELKVQTICEMGAGRSGKLQLQFDRRLWNRNGPWGKSNGASYSDRGYQATWEATRAQRGSSGILVNYTGGSVTGAMSTTAPYVTESDARARRDAVRFLDKIRPVFPGLAQEWNGKIASSLPHLSPDLGLAYSYWRVGQYQRFGGYGAVPQGNVFFAGEHTSTDFQGFMEGGAAEGIRAAQEVLDSLRLARNSFSRRGLLAIAG